MENFRPQEVHEKVTYAEPLSPPNEQEAPAEMLEDEGADEWSIIDVEAPEEKPVVESVIGHKVESGLSSEPSFTDEADLHQFITPSLTSHISMTEKPFSSSDELDKNVADATSSETLHLEDKSVQEASEQEEAGKATLEDMTYCAASERAAEEEDMQQLSNPADASGETEHVDEEEEEDVEEEISDCESQILPEPTLESMSSSLKSECVPVEGDFNKDTASEDRVEIKQELSSFTAEVNGVEVEKLYLDGEEMDTWDSVIEKKVDVGTHDDGVDNEGKNQHAEPEEDISAKEPESKTRNISQESEHVECSMMPTQVDDRQHISVGHEQAPPPDDDEEEEDEEEDSQNVSVSWRTELESDSYAQDNTLADTRPLIRYKSDETDGNAQQLDESESSEGEQEKKMREAGNGTWSDGKSKTFGTMEDLCEDVEEETIDDEYDLGYTHTEDRDLSHSTIVNEIAGNYTENAGELVRNDSEGHSEEETEELTRPRGRTHIDYDVELETDRLVEQELEDLSTDIYSAHFALKQVSNEMLHLEDVLVQDVSEQGEAGEETTEDMLSCEPEKSVNHQHVSSTAIIDQASEKALCSDSMMVMPPTDFVAEEVVQPKDQEEDENNISKVTQADVIGHCGFSDLFGRADMEDTNKPEDPNAELPVTVDEKNMQNVTATHEFAKILPEEMSDEAQDFLPECPEGFYETSEDEETVEWEVLENSTRDSINSQELADEGAVTYQKKTAESTATENDIYIVKDATDGVLHNLFPSSENNDFWVSSLQSGATSEQDGACNEAAEQTYRNQRFVDRQGWENLENPKVMNGNSSAGGVKEKEQMYSEMRKMFHNIAEGETFHSEEFEIEAGSWSSGE